MCDYCKDDKRLLSKDVICNICVIGGDDGEIGTLITFVDRGYLRMVYEDDCSCLHHGEKIKINYCPMCGEKM